MEPIQENTTEEAVGFFISDKMCLALQKYFLTDAGYISHEFHPDVHKFFRELEEHIKLYVLPTKR